MMMTGNVVQELAEVVIKLLSTDGGGGSFTC